MDNRMKILLTALVVAVAAVIAVAVAVGNGHAPDPAQQYATCTQDKIAGTPLPSYCASVGVYP